MIYGAWLELDDVVFECKEFQERNRGTYEQVVSDLARLGSQLAKLGEEQVSANQGVAKADTERKDADSRLETLQSEFTQTRFENAREMSIRKNDLAVFDFILNATACKDEALLQVSMPQVQVCSSKDGPELNFNNPKLQAQLELMMTPAARLALREALGQAEGPLKLLQIAEEPAEGLTDTTTALPTYAAKVVPVAEEPHAGGQWKKCVDGTPNCGLLHDLMSLQWGKFKDSFDELTKEMSGNLAGFEATKRNINDELAAINDDKTKYTEAQASTVSQINADTEEMNEKDEQKRELTHDFDKTCATFRAKITEILFTKICAVRKVRNELLVNSKVSPPSNVSDCDFSDWASKTGECMGEGGVPILCDDTCPQKDPYKCGGSEIMKRDVVVIPNANGMKCPPLERQKKCGQKKCPIDCVLSAWSGWSKCTKDCESGVQGKTRSILTKPKNGGVACDAVQEDRPCNTGSCDRDCTLVDWTEWAPCSMACGGGRTTRTRKVLVPIRGQGKCPTKAAVDRLEDKVCNAQDCIGDEVCIAQQDLILMVDASGSLRESGFEIVKNFAVNLTKKYYPEYYGRSAVKIGVALFGNGHLITAPDGSTTVMPAINVQSLTMDFDAVRTKLAALTWQRGFTNMAQGFTLADTMLGQGGRPAAQSAVLVISDGKYSFKFQTAEKAQELKDKNVQIFMAPITEVIGEELKDLKAWASSPWETNYERIPGLSPLKFNSELFVQKLIAKFCPDSFSPAMREADENQKQYIMIHEGGWPNEACGKRKLMPQSGMDADGCAQKARDQDPPLLAFGWGSSKNTRGMCFGINFPVTTEYWVQAKADRADLKCPNGEWEDSGLFDTYIINPSTV